MKTTTAAPLLILLAVAACGTGRDAILSRTFAGLTAAEHVFVSGDAAAQARIVVAAKSEGEGRAALEAYRGRRVRVRALFELAYSAVAAASLDLTEAALSEAIAVGAEAVRAVRALFAGGGR